MKKIMLFVGLLLVLMSGCVSKVDGVMMKGFVEDIRFDSEGTFVVLLVKGEIDREKGYEYDYGWVTVNYDDTEILLNGEKMEDVIYEVGMEVEVTFDGAVAESYPVQGAAARLNVLK